MFMETPRSLTVEVAGKEVRIATRGSGAQAYVLVPGIGVSPRYFVPLARELAAVGTVHTVELPGFGGSRKPRRRLEMTDFAGIVRQALAEAGVGPAVLIGHSMGCQIVAEMTLARPELTQSLVLLGPTTNSAERNRFLQGLRLAQDTLREPPQINYVVFSDYLRSGPRWYFTTVPVLVHHRLEEALARISVPILILRGERDPIVPRRWTQELAATSASACAGEVEGEAHVLMFRRPRTVAAACQQLAELTA